MTVAHPTPRVFWKLEQQDSTLYAVFAMQPSKRMKFLRRLLLTREGVAERLAQKDYGELARRELVRAQLAFSIHDGELDKAKALEGEVATLPPAEQPDQWIEDDDGVRVKLPGTKPASAAPS